MADEILMSIYVLVFAYRAHQASHLLSHVLLSALADAFLSSTMMPHVLLFAHEVAVTAHSPSTLYPCSFAAHVSLRAHLKSSEKPGKWLTSTCSQKLRLLL